jgi:uncharacterized protein
MKLDVKSLVNAPMGESESLTIELFNEVVDDDVLAERIRGNLTLTKLEDEILAKFEGKAKLKTACDRCAAEFVQEIPFRFSEEYSLDRKHSDPETPSVSSQFEIDVTEPLRQEMISAIPVKNLCKEDCVGICQKCGKNLNDGPCECK